jgi:hypothetical protein
VLLFFCVSYPTGAAQRCVIPRQQTFLNTEFQFCRTANGRHLSPLFRYASVRLGEWDTLIRKLSQQLPDKIISLSVLLVDPRWVLPRLMRGPYTAGLDGTV